MTRMTKTLTTEGINDLNDEQVEVWKAGDKFRVASGLKHLYHEETHDKVLTVAFIEWDEEDPNNFVLYYIEDGYIGYVHRMDVERVEPLSPGQTGMERDQTINTIAELLWNSDGSPAMSDDAYQQMYRGQAINHYNNWRAGLLDPWWMDR